jgi:hypothetical protein
MGEPRTIRCTTFWDALVLKSIIHRHGVLVHPPQKQSFPTLTVLGPLDAIKAAVHELVNMYSRNYPIYIEGMGPVPPTPPSTNAAHAPDVPPSPAPPALRLNHGQGEPVQAAGRPWQHQMHHPRQHLPRQARSDPVAGAMARSRRARGLTPIRSSHQASSVTRVRQAPAARDESSLMVRTWRPVRGRSEARPVGLHLIAPGGALRSYLGRPVQPTGQDRPR